MELDYEAMGKRIAKRRVHMGLKQTQLAEQTGISNNYLSGIERGKEKPSLEVLMKLCRLLKVTPDYFLLGNLYSNNVPQNIMEGLRLCSERDVNLIYAMIQHMVDRNQP